MREYDKYAVERRLLAVTNRYPLCIHWLHSSAMKDAGLRIRVQRELREQFLDVCRAHDKPAAQVLREFMRDYVTRHMASSDVDQKKASIAQADAELYRLKR